MTAVRRKRDVRDQTPSRSSDLHSSSTTHAFEDHLRSGEDASRVIEHDRWRAAGEAEGHGQSYKTGGDWESTCRCAGKQPIGRERPHDGAGAQRPNEGGLRLVLKRRHELGREQTDAPRPFAVPAPTCRSGGLVSRRADGTEGAGGHSRRSPGRGRLRRPAGRMARTDSHCVGLAIL